MLKLQEKLFFRSNVRKIILAILLLGGMAYHIWIFVRENVTEDIHIYGYLEFWPFQMRLFVYYFILILFMAYDYFREVPDAALLDIVKVSGGCAKSEFAQAFVMLQWILLSAGMVFAASVYGFYIGGTLTEELFFYLCGFVFLYMILNGIMLVLLAWLLARTVGKLLGYICIILFSFCVSPVMVSEIGFLSMLFRGLHDAYKVFPFIPEEMTFWFPGTLHPVNWSIASRTLFWIFLFSLGLLQSSRNRHKKWLVPIMALLTVADVVYVYLPASFYNGNGDAPYGESNSVSYDNIVYMIDESETGKEADGFAVEQYQMALSMGRIMEASVSVFPADGNLPEYRMTLYHLYDVEAVTDESGTPLPYDREGDYLTVYNQINTLECSRLLVMGEGKILADGTQEDISRLAEGKVYEIPRSLREDSHYVEKEMVEDGVETVRILTGQTMKTGAVKPIVEDGYLCVLKGI